MAIGMPPWLTSLLRSRTVWIVVALCLSHGLIAHWADGRGYDRRVAFETAAAAATNEAIAKQNEEAEAVQAATVARLKQQTADALATLPPDSAAVVFSAIPASVQTAKPITKQQFQPAALTPRPAATIAALNKIRVYP